MALTRVRPTTGRWQCRRQTCAIEWLIRRLEGRQVAVTGLGGSALSIIVGNYDSCAVLVSGFRKEEGMRGCWFVCRRVQGLMGPAALGRFMGLDQASLGLCVGAPAQRLA